MEVQVLSSTTVVTTLILELGKQIELIQHFWFQTMVFSEVVKQLF